MPLQRGTAVTRRPRAAGPRPRRSVPRPRPPPLGACVTVAVRSLQAPLPLSAFPMTSASTETARSVPALWVLGFLASCHKRRWYFPSSRFPNKMAFAPSHGLEKVGHS